MFPEQRPNTSVESSFRRRHTPAAATRACVLKRVVGAGKPPT
ncbi:MAG: hypothetical protein ABR603_08815 [Pyrinomonadaceae bacterium]